MARGREFLRQQREQLGGGSRQRSGYRLQNNFDGSRVQFWFLTEGDDVQVVLAHMVKVKTSYGERKYERLCGKERAEEPNEVCPRCADPNDESGEPWVKPVYYIYVESIYHPSQTDWKGTFHSDWLPKNQAGSVHYEEVVNEVRLLRHWKLEPQIEEAGAGDPTLEDPDEAQGTLLTHRYQWVTTGQKTQRVDTLVTGGQVFAELPPEIAAVRDTLPPLLDTLVLEWGDKLSGRFAPGGTKPTVTVAPPAEIAGTPPADVVGENFSQESSAAVEPVDF